MRRYFRDLGLKEGYQVRSAAAVVYSPWRVTAPGVASQVKVASVKAFKSLPLDGRAGVM